MTPNSLLPNMRLLGMSSIHMGSDWLSLTQKIDQELDHLGLDLAEEAVYFFYSRGPEKILEGEGQCFVARSVIGPKREVAAPLSLMDWTACPVRVENVSGNSLEQGLQELIRRTGVNADQKFILRIRRELKEELIIHLEAIFHE